MFLINGEKTDNSEELASSLAFRQGDYVFTTIELLAGKRAVFLKDHFSRLKKASTFLYELEDNEWKEIEEGFRADFKMIEGSEKTRFLRLIFTSDQKRMLHCDEVKSQTKDFYKAKSVEIPSYRDGLESFLKIPNYILVAKELRKVQKLGFDDLVIKKNNHYLESSISNIFFVKDGRFITPPLDFILEGVSRKKLIDLLKNNKREVIEEKVEEIDFDYCFFSNSLGKLKFCHRLDQYDFKTDNKFIQSVQDLWMSYKENNSEEI
ncbi:MAG: aminotransferase class IV [Oligoflexia bacterium]|nr:aminotransferase class IV [Oligoflexia bacterium]